MAATAQQLAAITREQQAEEARRLEEQAAADAEGGTGAALAAVLTAALAAWVAVFGALRTVGSGVSLAAYLAKVRASVDRADGGLGRRAARAIQAALDPAAVMGARHAAEFAEHASGLRVDAPEATASETARDDARGIADTVSEQLRLAAGMLSPRMVSVTGWRGVVAGLGAARRAVTLVRSAVAWHVHRSINDGAAQTIRALEARTLWVAEADACVRCLAYSGEFADRDGLFPGGRSMDPASRSTTVAAINGPPLHPNCRCQAMPWRDDWAVGAGSLPDLLRAQALRSIASGGGRPSESRSARIRAAQVLLARRGIPAGVRRQAQATVAGHAQGGN